MSTGPGIKLSEQAEKLFLEIDHVDKFFTVPELSKKQGFFSRIIRKILVRLLKPISYGISNLSLLSKQISHQIETLDSQVFSAKKSLIETSKKLSAIENFILKDADSDQLWDNLYNRFENRFRGSFDLIFDRLDLRYNEKLKNLYRTFSNSNLISLSMIDLGCGRGEFLKLAKNVGFKTIGIDSLSSALSEAKNYGDELKQGDILSSLEKVPDQTVVIFSLLHVIEHLQPRYTMHMFREVYRSLVPGGAFLIETPSLYSLWNTARQFYLDPTHIRPLHPEFIRFLAEDIGFKDIEIIEFEAVDEPKRTNLTNIAHGPTVKEFRLLENWLFGSLDIAIWAKK